MNDITWLEIKWFLFITIEFAIHIFAINGILAWFAYMGR